MSARTAIAAVTVLAAATVGAVVVATPGSASQDDLAQVRNATAAYHDIAAAKADGFSELHDAADIACIAKAGAGGMGVHYVLGSRVGDPAIRADEPELVIYAPGKDGKKHLAAVEYVVIADAWANAGHNAAPALFGRTFTLVNSPNRYGLPAFFELHAWIWDTNKAGMFADYNPDVVCPS
jgi:hypothetical protein